jgi:glutathione synthase/RimK-type ligase-like ATP-grasp enzyme
MIRIAIAAVFAALLVALTGACGGDDTAISLPSPTTTLAAQDDAAIKGAVATVAAAIQERSADQIRVLLTADAAAKLKDADLQRAASCIPEGDTMQVQSQTIKPVRDGAQVDVSFAISRKGTPRDIKRTWRFQRQADGSWLLSERPECPF